MLLLWPGITVTVSFPALIKSESTSLGVGNGPKPNIPFSDCNTTFKFFGMKFDANIGKPTPRLTNM